MNAPAREVTLGKVSLYGLAWLPDHRIVVNRKLPLTPQEQGKILVRPDEVWSFKPDGTEFRRVDLP